MRLHLKFAPALALVFTAFVLFVHARPYDDAELNAFLAPDPDCALPCFMGIRPGVTTRSEATGILSVHPWVGETNMESDPATITTALSWNWSGLQPSLINGSWPGVLQTDGNQVTAISIMLKVRFGDVLLWRSPAQASVYCSYQFAGERSSVNTVVAYYDPDVGVAVDAPPSVPICRSRAGNCIQTMQSFMQEDARLTLGDNYLPLVNYPQLAQDLTCGYATRR